MTYRNTSDVFMLEVLNKCKLYLSTMICSYFMDEENETSRVSPTCSRTHHYVELGPHLRSHGRVKIPGEGCTLIIEHVSNHRKVV